MFNRLLFDTVPQSASFPFLKTAVQYRGTEMRTGKWLHWGKGKREAQKTEENGKMHSQKSSQKEATAWDGEIIINKICQHSINKVKADLNRISFLFMYDQHKMQNDIPRLPFSSTYEMKNWLVSLGRKEDIGRKTCSHGNTALGFIQRVSTQVPRMFGTVLEITSVSLSFCVSQARWGLHKISCLIWTTCPGATWGDPPPNPIHSNFLKITSKKQNQNKKTAE